MPGNVPGVEYKLSLILLGNDSAARASMDFRGLGKAGSFCCGLGNWFYFEN